MFSPLWFQSCLLLSQEEESGQVEEQHRSSSRSLSRTYFPPGGLLSSGSWKRPRNWIFDNISKCRLWMPQGASVSKYRFSGDTEHRSFVLDTGETRKLLGQKFHYDICEGVKKKYQMLFRMGISTPFSGFPGPSLGRQPSSLYLWSV